MVEQNHYRIENRIPRITPPVTFRLSAEGHPKRASGCAASHDAVTRVTDFVLPFVLTSERTDKAAVGNRRPDDPHRGSASGFPGGGRPGPPMTNLRRHPTKAFLPFQS